MSWLIFGLSDLLIEPDVPGLVSIAIILCLIIVCFSFYMDAAERFEALTWLDEQILKYPNPISFAENVPKIGGSIKSTNSDKGGYRYMESAWFGFVDTLFVFKKTSISSGENEQKILRNSVRASNFFNVEDLNCGPGFYRYLPGIFVSVGLLLTFLGLISALRVIEGELISNENPEQMREALSNLLRAASAKFIMSLTGLFASIFFTVVMRRQISRAEHMIHQICTHLEERVKFVSLEELIMEQLSVTQRNEESFREIGMELVDRIGEKLRQEMEPVVEGIGSIGQAGVEGVNDMVKNLSKLFSKEVADVLTGIGVSLEKASTEVSITSKSVTEGTKETLEVLNNFSNTGAVILQDAARKIEDSANTISGASQTLASAADPIRRSVEQIDASISDLSENASMVSEVMIKGAQEIADSAAKSLAAACDALGGEREALAGTLADLKDVFNSANNLDQNLKSAFESYVLQVNESMQNLHDQVSTINRELEPAIEKLRKLVEHATKFIPAEGN